MNRSSSSGGFDGPLAPPAWRGWPPAGRRRPGGCGGTADTRRAEHWLVHADAPAYPLPVRRWHGPPEPAVAPIVARCLGPTIDLGCGPGRLAATLARRGVVTLGVDISAHAVRLTRARGAAALRRDIFAPLPAEGRWAHALLIDGNIGIGGDPVALLRRCAALLAPGGTVFTELEPPGTGLWQGLAHVASTGPDRGLRRGSAFRWARVGVESVQHVTAGTGLRVTELLRCRGRWFAELVRR
ncbi:class I SAM-dependent methyltransferase [Plantactinospora sp. KLBMP9567]|uniref:class I SAM-dependent methyltransferase n=1 Tax=Plantactinospora sp. KLBMP9567 TaxID=3085900 RepID=UPI00298193FC|nr:class I SAM-dependent methyltransferase [Plantactinospora sp. KLBMP9567]MDW5330159.1 class I SAM-dependent methyltransferase [Plantactinospora sp. KLBMP9567]